MSKSISYPMYLLGESLDQYFREVWQFPVLEKEHEQMLAIRLRESGDTNAAHSLVTSHLRLVVKIAMKYRGYGLPISDLISEGNIGLMRAVKKFDPDKGFRLSTYAMWWIRASITEFVLKSWSLVRMGTVASQKKLFFSLRRLKSRLNMFDSGELTESQASELSSKLNATPEQVSYMNRRLSGRDFSLNTPLRGDKHTVEVQDTLVDPNPSQEAVFAQNEEKEISSKYLAKSVALLPERERYIFTQRRLVEDPPTLEDLGKQFGVSRERIRQLESRAFDKVRASVVAQSREFKA